METDACAGYGSPKCPLCVHQSLKPSAGVTSIKQAGCPHAAFLVTPPKLLRRVDLTGNLRTPSNPVSTFCGRSTTTTSAQVVASLTQQDREKLRTLSRPITRVGVAHDPSPDSDSRTSRSVTLTRDQAAPSTGWRYFPVTDFGFPATSSGVPLAMTRPPAAPPSGPRSIK